MQVLSGGENLLEKVDELKKRSDDLKREAEIAKRQEEEVGRESGPGGGAFQTRDREGGRTRVEPARLRLLARTCNLVMKTRAMRSKP